MRKTRQIPSTKAGSECSEIRSPDYKLSQSKPASDGIARGDIRVVNPVGDYPTHSRLGLVLAVHTRDQFCQISLVHDNRKMLCSSDGLVPSAVSSSPCDLIVQTDLRGVVWIAQLGKRIGQINEASIREIAAITRDFLDYPTTLGEVTSSSGMISGTYLMNDSDPRWAFKESEGNQLRGLAEDCTITLLNRDA